MNWTPVTTRTIDLGYEQLLTLQGRPGTRVRVLYGAMWLTEEGDLRDVFARCGDEVTLESGGLSVIEGVGPARVQVIEPRPVSKLAQAAKRLAHVWDAMQARRSLRDVFARSVLMGLAAIVSIAVLHIAVPGPLALQTTTMTAQAHVQARPDGTFGTVPDGLASARTGFLTVN
jgi:hypothetical protein